MTLKKIKMGNFDTTKTTIKNAIKENNNQEITGSILQNILINMLNNIGVGYIFGGVATPTTKPESITGTNAPVYYIANEVGTYVNFNNIVVNENEFVFLINGSDKKWKKAFVNIPIATTSADGLITKEDKKYIETLKPWLRRSLGNFDSSEELNNYLNGLSFNTLDNGQYIAYVGNVPLFITFAKLNATNKISAIWVEGSLSVIENKISSNSSTNVAIAYRHYENGAWKSWKTIGGIIDDSRIKALEDKMPSVQSSVNGTNKNYIYSTGTDADKNCVASCNWWIYSKSGRVYVRWKRWGADDNTHYDHNNEAHQTSQYMIPYMGSDNGACYRDGLLPYQWGQRMKDAGVKFSFIREEQSTADQVNLRYLNFANGNVYDTPISKATSAKAGVMTAADKTKLDNLTAYARDLGNFESEEAALNALKDVEISGNSNIVHVHCTYANGAMSITMMQSIKNDYCRQVIFNKSKVFQRAIHFTDGTRQEISWAEDWSCLFGDRLQWDSGENKYVLRQFDLSFNKKYTDPIPVATYLNDGLMSKEDKKKLKVANVIYNVYSLVEQEIEVDIYPSDTEDFKSGQELRIFKTKGKDLPSGINPEKYGIWFGAYLGPTAGYKRYNTKSICGITSEELFTITSLFISENYYIFADNDYNYAVLFRTSSGLNISNKNPDIKALLSMQDIKKLLIK